MGHTLLATLALAALVAPALASPIFVSGSIGGAPTGVVRENFNALPLSGSPAAATTATGIAIDFTGMGNGQGRTAQIPDVGGRQSSVRSRGTATRVRRSDMSYSRVNVF